MPIPIIAGAVASGVSGLVGHLSNMSAQERAQAIQEKGVQEWLKLNIPDPAAQKLALEKFVSAGELIPQLEAPLKNAETEFKKIQSDPRLKEARMRSLGSLEEQGYGGEQVQDAAAREKAIIESGAANRGHQQAIVSDLGRRGQLGGGLELTARLDAQQADADRLANQSLGLESDRRNRALNAISGAGDLAGKIQSQDYAEQSDAAKAADAINLFNTSNFQNVSNRNTDRANSANQWNLTNAQDIANNNTKTANFEQQYNKELNQQRFENEAKKTAGITGQYGQQAAGQVAAGQGAAQMWGGIASGAGQLGIGAAKYMQDEKDKEAKK